MRKWRKSDLARRKSWRSKVRNEAGRGRCRAGVCRAGGASEAPEGGSHVILRAGEAEGFFLAAKLHNQSWDFKRHLGWAWRIC